MPGVVGVYTYEDVPKRRFTIAGQSYPQPSPYDRLILENLVRYQNEEVAIVAAETEEAADKALKLIKVDYEVLEPCSTLPRRSITTSWSTPRAT